MAGAEVTVLVEEDAAVRGARCVVEDGSVVRTHEAVIPLATEGETAASDVENPEGEEGEALGAFVQAARQLSVSRPVVAVPLSRVMARILMVPEAARDEIDSYISLQLEGLFPSSDGEELAARYEVLCESTQGVSVFAAMLPEAEAERIAATAGPGGIYPARLDVAALGWYRMLSANNPTLSEGTVAAVLAFSEVPDLIILCEGVPVFMRSLGESEPEAISREVMLSLIEAERGHSAAQGENVRMMVFATAARAEAAEQIRATLATSFETTLVADIDPFGCVMGIAQRVAEGGGVDLTPQAWRDAARARVVSKRTALASAIVAGLALIGLLVLHGGPLVYSMMTDHLRGEIAAKNKPYKAACDIRDRVVLVKSYGDRARSALELLKLTSDSLAEGSSTLISFRFNKGVDVRISGQAETPGEVYTLKENLDKAMGGDEPLFAEVVLTGPSKNKDQYKFDIVAKFPQAEEQK